MPLLQSRTLRIAALLALTACGTPDMARGTTDSATVPATTSAIAWSPPTEADIPHDSLGAAIRRGFALLRFTPESLPEFAPSNLRCTSCHQLDGTKRTAAPLTAAHARYPRYMARAGAVVSLTDRINYCFTRSLAGRALPADSREMEDLLALMAFLSKGLPVGGTVPGADGLIPMADTLAGDPVSGARVYARECAVCHQPDGGGTDAIPALWGPRSLSIGASMARLERAASFIWHNMPQTAPGKLSVQEAYDVAAYVIAQPRPDSPGKQGDWPAGGTPADVPYATRGHVPSAPPARLLPRPPSGTTVPAPVPVRRRAPGGS